jgi:hypothetical protein
MQLVGVSNFMQLNLNHGLDSNLVAAEYKSRKLGMYQVRKTVMAMLVVLLLYIRTCMLCARWSGLNTVFALV